MPLTYQALKCIKCNTFQAKQTNNAQKFSCALCGEKQTIQRVYAISPSAKDIRLHVQQLNMARGQAYQMQQEVLANVMEQLAANEDAIEVDTLIQQQDSLGVLQQQQTGNKTASRHAEWHNYVDRHEGSQNDSEDNNRHAYDDARFVTAIQTARQRKGNKPCSHSSDTIGHHGVPRKHKQQNVAEPSSKHFAANFKNQPKRAATPAESLLGDEVFYMPATYTNLSANSTVTACLRPSPQIPQHCTQHALRAHPLNHTNHGTNQGSNCKPDMSCHHQAQHGTDVPNTQPREQMAYATSCYSQSNHSINNQFSSSGYQSITSTINHQLDSAPGVAVGNLKNSSCQAWQPSQTQNTTALKLLSTPRQATHEPALIANQHVAYNSNVSVHSKGNRKWETFAVSDENSNPQSCYDHEDAGFVTAL